MESLVKSFERRNWIWNHFFPKSLWSGFAEKVFVLSKWDSKLYNFFVRLHSFQNCTGPSVFTWLRQVVGAPLGPISNTIHCWYVSKWELTWLSYPWDPSLQSSFLRMYVLLHTHIRQFTVIAVHFFVVDEKNLQRLEKIVVDFFHLHQFFLFVWRWKFIHIQKFTLRYCKDGDPCVCVWVCTRIC